MEYITSTEIKKIFPSAVSRTYDSGQIIVYQGDQPMHAFYIVKGAIKFYDIDEHGNEKIFHIIGPNSFFPLFYFFSRDREVSSFYSTLTKTELMLIPAQDFNANLFANLENANSTFNWMTREVEAIMQRIKSLTKNDARQKVLETLNYLLTLHSKEINGGWNRVNFALTQQTLAYLTNLSRETVNVVIKELEAGGVVRYARQAMLEIHKPHLYVLL